MPTATANKERGSISKQKEMGITGDQWSNRRHIGGVRTHAVREGHCGTGRRKQLVGEENQADSRY